jgi:hypothetical protein
MRLQLQQGLGYGGRPTSRGVGVPLPSQGVEALPGATAPCLPFHAAGRWVWASPPLKPSFEQAGP